jgi:hypothetical protein
MPPAVAEATAHFGDIPKYWTVFGSKRNKVHWMEITFIMR